MQGNEVIFGVNCESLRANDDWLIVHYRKEGSLMEGEGRMEGGGGEG
jgi:hypothetical protein